MLIDREIYRILQAGNLEIMDEMESMSEHVEVMSEQLESLVQQHTTDGNITTGSFDNPAHNCSHIKHNHPNSYSGTTNSIQRRGVYRGECQSDFLFHSN